MIAEKKERTKKKKTEKSKEKEKKMNEKKNSYEPQLSMDLSYSYVDINLVVII